ncbi:MAG: histidine kinase [Erysipelotrichia bacterium]|nr:histidine kinase [Erysipelotrichia bacterium]
MTSLWLTVQLIVLSVLLICIIVQMIYKQENRLIIVLPLNFSALFEVINAWTGWWSRGLDFNIVFISVFAVVLIWFFKDVPAKYKAAEVAHEMEQELSSNRIAIMLSQIQPHFLYNALSAIRALYKTG